MIDVATFDTIKNKIKTLFLQRYNLHQLKLKVNGSGRVVNIDDSNLNSLVNYNYNRDNDDLFQNGNVEPTRIQFYPPVYAAAVEDLLTAKVKTFHFFHRAPFTAAEKRQLLATVKKCHYIFNVGDTDLLDNFTKYLL